MISKGEFLKKALGKVNPTEFLLEHADTISCYKRLTPIYRAFLAGEALKDQSKRDPESFPTPTLRQICLALGTEKDKSGEKKPEPKEEGVEKPAANPSGKPAKKLSAGELGKEALKLLDIPNPIVEGQPDTNYYIQLVIKDDQFGQDIEPKNANGDVVPWKKKGHYMAAQAFAARRLVERQDALRAIISREENGKVISTEITRDHALSIVFPKERGPANKRVAKISSSLRWGPRTHDYKQQFSRG